MDMLARKGVDAPLARDASLTIVVSVQAGCKRHLAKTRDAEEARCPHGWRAFC